MQWLVRSSNARMRLERCSTRKSHAKKGTVCFFLGAVALPLATAVSAGLTCQGKGLMKTGNGVAQVCTTTIEKLKFGHFTLRYVQAVVMPNLSQPLLGMNVLKQFRVEQDNGEMRLSKKY